MKVQNGKSLSKWQNQKFKHIKRMDYNCHTPDFTRIFSCKILLIKPSFIKFQIHFLNSLKGLCFLCSFDIKSLLYHSPLNLLKQKFLIFLYDFLSMCHKNTNLRLK